MATKAYSLWIYDRHCTLIYHHDWTVASSPSSSTPSPSRPLLNPGPDLLPGVSRCVTTSSTAARDGASSVGQGYPNGGSSSSRPNSTPSAPSGQLPLTEHAKLIYGLVYSLRNMLSKLSPSSGDSNPSRQQSLPSAFNTYTTPTYSLSHLQTASMYTFVLLTDPVQPPSRGLGVAPPPTRPASALLGVGGGSDPMSGGAPTGGGIPGSGGMSLPGVLKQIVGGPWLEWVVRNPATTAMLSGSGLGEGQQQQQLGTGGLEWEEMDDVELGEDGDGQADGVTDGEGSGVKGSIARATRSRGVDSDGFRSGVEAVLAQNKLSTVF
ncbi:hypothetical protein BDZ90DRAFT_258598 [Jaminaea rosea]|uniref:Trafficking protein particle complex subunit n=1 Tax=Jaminaea rosea TaxID=1569628 RepID=A0A316UWM6_9BASI|nr:hypothetical protein BDZ90DRAFT_258598 [Jaminaea rosea]PWN29689.1 hypothetical protein BDZ90DRAFT_258598 [Jaminaea rosea]